MRLRQHTLSLFFGTIFVLALIGQSFAGLAVFNEEQVEHGAAAVGWVQFVTSSDFVVDVAEILNAASVPSGVYERVELTLDFDEVEASSPERRCRRRCSARTACLSVVSSRSRWSSSATGVPSNRWPMRV